jgi:hypothetical protein
LREGDPVSRQIRISSPLGSLAVGRAGIGLGTVVGAYGLRERGGLTGWGLWSQVCARGGRFGAQNQKSRRTGAILVGPAKSPQLMIAGACRLRDSGQFCAWEAWNPRYTGGGT